MECSCYRSVSYLAAEAEAAHLRPRHHRRLASLVGDQRHLPEGAATAVPVYHGAFDQHLRLAVLDDVHRVPDLAYAMSATVSLLVPSPISC